jgi:tetratricopeptide (TPR) repeat protein
MALVGSCIAGCTTIRQVQLSFRSERDIRWSGAEVFAAFRDSLLRNMLLLVIPLIVLWGNVLFVKNCSIPEGLQFFFLLPVVSVWFSASLGLFCAVHYRWSRTSFMAIMLASIAYAAAVGYLTPPIFSYNVFYGYFPGLSYDEILRISLSLVLFRLVTIGLGGILLRLALLLVQSSTATDSTVQKGSALVLTLVSRRHRVPAVGILVTLALLYSFRCDLGWEATAGFIQSQLGESYSTTHFVIYYSSSDIRASDIRRLAGEHEFRLAQLLADFGLSSYSRIESYVYPTNEVKRKLIGTGTTNIAKPWNAQIHLTKQSLEGMLKHELAHVVAGQFGVPVIRVSLSTGLVEGLATALDWTWGNRTLHQYVAAMKKFDSAPDISRMMSFWGFASQTSAVSYVAAGSFCRYLLDAYGMKRMLAVYRTGEYEAAYGRSLTELVEEWNRFLGRIHVSENERDIIDALFHQPTIFRKTCARVVAGRNEHARVALANRDYASALKLYRTSFDEAEGYEPLSGLIIASVRLGDYAGASRLGDSVFLKQARPAQFLPLFVWCGDALWVLGDTNRARLLFDRVRIANVTDNLTEAATVRLLALADSVVRDPLLRYFLLDIPDSIRAEHLDSLARLLPNRNPLIRYLQGRVLARMGKAADAVALLDPLDLFAMSRELEAVRRTTVALQLYTLGRYDLARNTFWQSLNVLANEATVTATREWVTRCDWMARHGY